MNFEIPKHKFNYPRQEFQNLELDEPRVPQMSHQSFSIKKLNSVGKSRFSAGRSRRRYSRRRSYRRGSRRQSIKSFVQSSSGNNAFGLSYVELTRMTVIADCTANLAITSQQSITDLILNSAQWASLVASFKKFRPISFTYELAFPAVPDANISTHAGPIQVYHSIAEGAPANYVATGAAHEMNCLSTQPMKRKFYFKLAPDSTAFSTQGFIEAVGVSLGHVKVFGVHQTLNGQAIAMTVKFTCKVYAWDPW